MRCKRSLPGTAVYGNQGEGISRGEFQPEHRMQRRHTVLELPPLRKEALTGRELWEWSRSAHAIVTWHYLCTECDNWHHDYAGGYFITEDGVVATCEHVISPHDKSYREGYLVVITPEGRLFPVVEVLAADKGTDAALLRVKVDVPVPALPLNVSVYPGDCAWCYSAPLEHPGFFSRGIVNRFYRRFREGVETVGMQVSTDWAPGSSGSALLDAYGNAIGHVSTIRPASSSPSSKDRNKEHAINPSRTQIVFRSATRAADVLALTRPGRTPAVDPDTTSQVTNPPTPKPTTPCHMTSGICEKDLMVK